MTLYLENAQRFLLFKIAEIQDQHIAVGFDAEWSFVPGIGRRAPIIGKVAIIQLAFSNDAVQIIRLKNTGPPHALKTLLESPNIIKTGRGLSGDIRKLAKDFPNMECEPKGLVDLGRLAKTKGVVKDARVGLQRLCQVVLDKYLDKDPSIRLGNWDDVLSPEQKAYAAVDALVSLKIFTNLNSLPTISGDALSKRDLKDGERVFLLEGGRAVLSGTVVKSIPATIQNAVVVRVSSMYVQAYKPINVEEKYGRPGENLVIARVQQLRRAAPREDDSFGDSSRPHVVV